MRVSEISPVNVGSVGSSTNASNVGNTDKSIGDVVDDVNISVQSHSEEIQDGQAVIDDEMLDKSVEQANKTLSNYNRYIERSVHEKTKAIMYVMKDTKTNEIIREFPPKKIQDMIAKMWELAGLFVDEKA